MTKIDRYILVLFLRTVFICFCSIAGIFIVFHAFNSMDDFVRQGETQDGLVRVMMRFYGPYMLLLFDMTGAMITLLALLFTVGWMRRTGELTATLAAGVSHGRILKPMVIASLAIVLVQLANREFVLPHYRDHLSMKAKFRAEEVDEPLLQRYDQTSAILIAGETVKPQSHVIVKPNFRIFGDYPAFGDSLLADSAHWLDADATHPAGYLLRNVKLPEQIDTLPSVGTKERPILMTSRDQRWLDSGQCFFATSVHTDLLLNNQSSKRLFSVAELIRRVRNPAVRSSAAIQVALHERILRVPLDFALVCLGLPLVVNRREKNVFVMVAAALLTVLGFFMLKTVSGAMGGSGYLLSPAMAAWMPLLVLGPVAYSRLREVQTV